jgi:YHS domain-containing protein
MLRVGVVATCVTVGRGVEAAPELEQVIVAIEGYCPVSYQTVGEPTPGVPNFASEYNGYTYFMASAKAKELFDQDPGRYAPQIGGLCPVGLGGPYGNKFASDPRVFAVIDKKLYLISSVRAKRSFDTKPGHYISQALDLYNEPAIGRYCPISYLSEGKPVKGVKEFAREFRGQIFYLAGAKEAEILATKGAAAMAAYEGSCAEGVSRGKRFPGNPLVFATFLGKAYLFYDEEAKTKFMSNATTLVDEANAKWPSIRVKKGPTGGP